MSLLNSVRRRRTAALTSGAALLVALTGAAVVPSADAAALTVTDVSVNSSSTTTVHTSKGKDLNISFYSYKSVSDSSSPARFSVALRLPSGAESHSWSFNMPRSGFAINGDGKGSLDLGAAKMGPFGKVALKVTPIGAAKYTTCQGVKVSKQRKVSIDGTLLFDTGSPWGTVGKGKTIHFSDPSYVYWSYKNNADCSGPTPTMPCTSGTSWYASSYDQGDSLSIYGGVSNGRTYLNASRGHMISKPTGAYRYDSVYSNAPAPKLASKPDGSAKLTVKGDVGGATLSSPGPASKNTEKCGSNGKKEQSSSWSSSYKNAATHLKVQAQAFGAISLPDGGTTYSSFSKTKIVS